MFFVLVFEKLRFGFVDGDVLVFICVFVFGCGRWFF